MQIFKNWVKEYKELEEEVRYYSRENYLKEERYRKLNKEYKDLQKKYEELEAKYKDLAPKKRGRKKNDKNRKSEESLNK